MCKFCERYKHPDGHMYVDLMHDDNGSMACIVEPSPISIRKNSDLPATIQIFSNNNEFYIPIKYCPICGAEVKRWLVS